MWFDKAPERHSELSFTVPGELLELMALREMWELKDIPLPRLSRSLRTPQGKLSPPIGAASRFPKQWETIVRSLSDPQLQRTEPAWPRNELEEVDRRLLGMWLGKQQVNLSLEWSELRRKQKAPEMLPGVNLRSILLLPSSDKYAKILNPGVVLLTTAAYRDRQNFRKLLL